MENTNNLIYEELYDESVLPEGEESEKFVVDNDIKADWCIKKIKQKYEERDRLKAIAVTDIEVLNNKMIELDEKCERETGYFKYLLYDYYNSIADEKKNETKTKIKYKLLNGSLVYKKPKSKLIKDNEQLLEWLKKNDRAEFIETKEDIKWADLKKNIDISTDMPVIKDTGEIIQGVKLEQVNFEFIVE